MGRRQNDSETSRWAFLILLLMGFVSCSLVYMCLSVAFRPKNYDSVSDLFLEGEDKGEFNEELGSIEGKCCKGVDNLELWGSAVKWGSDFKFNSSEECCRACKEMCRGGDGPCLCDSWVFCGNREECGPKFGECWLKKQKDTLAPDRQDFGEKVSWTSGIIFGKGEGIVGLETKYGVLHIKLFPECAPHSVNYILELLGQRHCAGCQFYRAESRGSSWDSNGNHIKDKKKKKKTKKTYLALSNRAGNGVDNSDNQRKREREREILRVKRSKYRGREREREMEHDHEHDEHDHEQEETEEHEHNEHDNEHEVYGGEIPDEGEMDADVEMSRAEEDDDPNSKENLEEMKKRLKEIEDEAGALREMQAKVEKEMGAVQDPSGTTATQAEKEEVDARSIYVGNVDYACTPEEVQQHFQSCGTVNRVTILTDKFGQPKGFAYVEFVETDAVQNAILLNESELHGRQLKVSAKRTNVPGMKQFRGRRAGPYPGFRGRRPFMPAPFFPTPYGYGKAPRFRRPMRYRPYY